jgi:hypothetical protein
MLVHAMLVHFVPVHAMLVHVVPVHATSMLVHVVPVHAMLVHVMPVHAMLVRARIGRCYATLRCRIEGRLWGLRTFRVMFELITR